MLFGNDQTGSAAGAVVTQSSPGGASQSVLEGLQAYYSGQDHQRRGICLLNAGQFDLASKAFSQAQQVNPQSKTLPALMAACHVGRGEFDKSAEQFEKLTQPDSASVTSVIRLALSQWKAEEPNLATATLRRAIASQPESAELHFQLGTLLATLGDMTEAELRFTQAIAIDKDHAPALVSLGLCHGAAGQPADAKRLLERAQRHRPHDARIGLLLSQAAKSLMDQGINIDVNAQMPDLEHNLDQEGVEQLSQVVEEDPDFVDAFLSLPSTRDASQIDREVYTLLAETLNRALDRRPGLAQLHCAAGRVLVKLGRHDDALAATERAVELDPQFTRALIQLAQVYQQTDRHDDALVRLEQALTHGAEYADVYYLMGNLYRRNGRLDRARWAYDQALKINQGYEAARVALATLAA